MNQNTMGRRKHVTLSFPAYRDLSNAVGLSQPGVIFGAGEDAPFNDVDIYVQKGRGPYAGQGGFFTTLAKLLANGSQVPTAARQNSS